MKDRQRKIERERAREGEREREKEEEREREINDPYKKISGCQLLSVNFSFLA